jgi:hypothetical protein
MTYEIDAHLWRILGVYVARKVKIPTPRAFALRLLEEAVELALACGASVKDTHVTVEAAVENEQRKDAGREYEAQRIESDAEIAGEIADVCLLAACTAAVANITDESVAEAARKKVDRLEAAAADGTLHFTPDGRFYRRPA